MLVGPLSHKEMNSTEGDYAVTPPQALHTRQHFRTDRGTRPGAATAVLVSLGLVHTTA
jgi:hypothetical protein